MEGIPFTFVGIETGRTLQQWEAFGRCLQTNFYNFIKDGVALAMYVLETHLAWLTGPIPYEDLHMALYQAGVEHPEYLTAFANTIRPGYDYTWWYFYMGTYDFRTSPLFWCVGALALFTGPIGILAKPIVMNALRGVKLTLKSKIAEAGLVSIFFHMIYEPTFTPPTTLGPPGFMASVTLPVSGQVTVVNITNLWAGGYYYPGIYDALIYWSAYAYGSEVGSGQFKIKNLAESTGTGVIS